MLDRSINRVMSHHEWCCCRMNMCLFQFMNTVRLWDFIEERETREAPPSGDVTHETPSTDDVNREAPPTDFTAQGGVTAEEEELSRRLLHLSTSDT
uniref:Uncharacterized protein n=1 Tax=Knipowitschia caucasica TaxID=637954 RepID=A0AAV2MIJ3_KNICA